MKYKISVDNEKRLEQFARSNYAQMFIDILQNRIDCLNEQFRRTLPEDFLKIQGRALELDDLIETLKIKGLGE